MLNKNLLCSPTENASNASLGAVASEGNALLKQAEVNEVLRKFPFIKRASEVKTPNNPYYRSYPTALLDDDILPALRMEV